MAIQFWMDHRLNNRKVAAFHTGSFAEFHSPAREPIRTLLLCPAPALRFALATGDQLGTKSSGGSLFELFSAAGWVKPCRCWASAADKTPNQGGASLATVQRSLTKPGTALDSL